jgi:WD40 repeat protein
VPTLSLLPAGVRSGGSNGEILSCSYTPDGAYVLTGGWDGHLRLWDCATGTQVAAFQARPKPIAACAISPDGERWLSGCLDGFLAQWDARSNQPLSAFLAHGRPISAIVFSGDGKSLATASWDRRLVLWDLTREREGRALNGHGDIVAGCRFTPDGKSLVSWSYDCTLTLWDVPRARPLAKFTSHADRVTAGAVSPDGLWAASGSRDGVLKLWDLQARQEVGSKSLGTEIRACFFLLDGMSVIAVDAHGRLSMHAVPDLRDQGDLRTLLPVQCAALSPSGNQVALGCENGQLDRVAVEGSEDTPLVITATRTSRRTATTLERLFGKSRLVHAYQCFCPACRRSFELSADAAGQSVACPHCSRSLRINEAALTG